MRKIGGSAPKPPRFTAFVFRKERCLGACGMEKGGALRHRPSAKSCGPLGSLLSVALSCPQAKALS